MRNCKPNAHLYLKTSNKISQINMLPNGILWFGPRSLTTYSTNVQWVDYLILTTFISTYLLIKEDSFSDICRVKKRFRDKGSCSLHIYQLNSRL